MTSPEKYLNIASNWMNVPDSDVINFKKAISDFLKINNINFKCGITPLASQLGYTISVIFENKTQKLKLTKQGFSYFKDLNAQIDSLILTGKNTFVKNCDNHYSYNLNPQGEKEYLCGGGGFPSASIESLKFAAFQEVNYQYVRNFKQLPDRFILILDLETIEVYDKKIKNVKFTKCYHSQEAYQQDGEVTCDISGKKCTDTKGNLLPEFTCFYHCAAKDIDYSSDYSVEANKGLDVSVLEKTQL